MRVPQATMENAEKLAQRVVEDMDLDALIEFAEEALTERYLSDYDQQDWEADWKLCFEGEI